MNVVIKLVMEKIAVSPENRPVMGYFSIFLVLSFAILISGMVKAKDHAALSAINYTSIGITLFIIAFLWMTVLGQKTKIITKINSMLKLTHLSKRIAISWTVYATLLCLALGMAVNDSPWLIYISNGSMAVFTVFCAYLCYVIWGATAIVAATNAATSLAFSSFSKTPTTLGVANVQKTLG
jgi:hypothetical protein